MQICGICGENHCPVDCDLVQIATHVLDREIPSKAKMTVPEDLELRKMADNTYTIAALYTIEKGTQFGPLHGQKVCSLLPSITFPLKIFSCEKDHLSELSKDEDYILSEYYLDTTNENECNWMMFVTPASSYDEQNAICYQDGESLYYVTTRDIDKGEDIKVWYSPYYASKMQKEILKPHISDQNETSGNNGCIDFLVQSKNNVTSREMWSCKFCGKTETNVAEFALHLLQHFREQSERVCPICNKTFLRKQGCESHMKTVHATDLTAQRTEQIKKKSNTPKKSDKTSDSVPKDNYLGDPLLLNELLNDSLDNTGLVLHSYTDINQIDLTGIENQNNLFENENLNLNTESVLPENVKGLDNFNFELVPDEAQQQFVCDICLKNFKTLRLLTIHMNAHTGRFACLECKKVFARKENIQNHSCARFYKFKCALCNSLFAQQKYLTFHIKTSHNKKCTNCDVVFDTEEQLKDHQCSNAKPKTLHPCNQCSTVFTHKNNLIIHKKQHRIRQQGKKYNCPICNAVLQSYKTYLKHQKIHEGHAYKCDLCDRVFPRSDNLKLHKDSVHSTQLSDPCEICKKSFKSKKLLSDHMTVHKQGNFRCPHCTSTFKQQKNLTRHINFIHVAGKSNSSTKTEEKSYSCPQCYKKMKFKTSVRRHLERVHSEYKVDIKSIKMDIERKAQTNLSKQAADVEDLKQTLENMDFNTDEINQDHEITIEIDKLMFNHPENFTSDSNDRLVESLINTAVSENNLDDDKCEQRDPMLSMPDLDMDSINLLSQSKG